MKRKTLLVLSTLAIVSQCIAGTLIDDPRTYPVLITHSAGMGSGFFIQASNSVYLVTAKHVLFGQPVGTNPPSLLSASATLKSFSLAGTTNVSDRVITVDLAQLYQAGEVRMSLTRDVALIRIEECETNNLNVVRSLPGVTFLSPLKGLHLRNQAAVCPASEVDVGAQVYMFGYPVSLTGPISGIFDPSEPLLRNGIVAGINLVRRTIIIDCPSYFGNSGGPVIQVDHPSLGVTRYRFIGLVSGFVPFQEEWENKTMRYSHVIKSNSGYTVVEPMDTVLEMVWR